MYFKKHMRILNAFFLAFASMIRGSAGTLDTSYGANRTGIVTTAIGRSNNIEFIAVQEDNSIVGVGTVSVLAQAHGICRYTSEGILDTSFNELGYKQVLIGSKALLSSVIVQPDTQAVVGGYTTEDNLSKFALARYNMKGELDPSFGKDGIVTTDTAGGSGIEALLLQPDGKIVAGGVAGQGTPSFALARYNPDGSLDTTFGDNGTVRVNPGYVSTVHALALQSDGKILAAGIAWDFESNVFALARFNVDGTLDETFGTNGMVTTLIGKSCQAQAMAIQKDGNIVLGGYTTNDNIHYAFALARYDAKGSLDPSFNDSGTVITELTYSSQLQALTIDTQGNILAGGYDFGPLNTTFALVRYLPSGILDETFGTKGVVLTPIGTNAQINSLIIQSDSKIVAAGNSDTSAALVRYLAE